MATDFDNLVADLERSYEELQARMADPAWFAAFDHRTSKLNGDRTRSAAVFGGAG